MKVSSQPVLIRLLTMELFIAVVVFFVVVFRSILREIYLIRIVVRVVVRRCLAVGFIFALFLEKDISHPQDHRDLVQAYLASQ